ncbi:MAG: FAD:protein FMN transferase [Elusimicrobiales bacterium]|nr:FAD:protein FMN transferase [Elusimicrobiales bacterium]
MTKPVVVKRTLMGSPFEITAWPGGPAGAAEAAILTAYAEIARVEDLITDWRDSPLERLNAAAGGPPVKVSEELFNLIEFALGVCRDSGGAFDITYSSVGMLWREAFRTGVPPSDAAIDAALKLTGHWRVEMDREKGTILLPEKGMRIGLGSIGKGYGVDRGARVLTDLGLRNFSVNGAGDIRLTSAPGAPRPWRIAVKNPFAADGRAAGILELRSGGVATSGDYERHFTHGGKKYHHIIDARTGRVRSDIASVTVTASTAALANACATSVMALGPEEGAAFLRRRRDASGFIISAEGTVDSCNIRTVPGRETLCCR